MTGNIGSCQRRYDGYQSAVKTFLQDKITCEKCNVKLYELFAVLFTLSKIIWIIQIESNGEKHDMQIRDIKHISNMSDTLVYRYVNRGSFSAI